MKSERIETESHRRDFAFREAEQYLIASGEETPEPGPEREAMIDEWLESHPEIVIGAVAQ